MKRRIVFFAIIVIGLALRFFLATGRYNNDIINLEKILNTVQIGDNLYKLFPDYNYTPVFFYLARLVKYIHDLYPLLPFRIFYRILISLLDLVTLYILLRISSLRNISKIRTAALFFLNPVSITISGLHGQFDNLVLIFLLAALYIHQSKIKWQPKIKSLAIWIFLTTSLVLKHFVIFHLFAICKARTGSYLKTFLYVSSSIIVFFLFFVPYWREASQQILNRVFGYGGLQDFYGISYFLRQFCGQCILPWGFSLFRIISYIFAVISFAIILKFKHKDLIRLSLIIFLYFLSFTTGIGAQYHVWPIALGALFPTKWFFLYSISTMLFFLGSVDEYNIPIFRTFSWNMVWVFTILWFFSEFLQISPRLRKIYSKLI